MSRQTQRAVNNKSMQIEEVEVLACPRCGKQETLPPRRQKKVYRVEGTALVNKTKTVFSYEDVCSACLQSYVEWFKPVQDN